jgi:restriction endonuclease S subunit
VRPKNKYINSATLVAFLSSKYGREEIDKYSMTSNQTNFSPAKFREIDIPIFSKAFNEEIDSVYHFSSQKLKQSEHFYHQAEALLLQEIGLSGFVPSAENINIKRLKESFMETGRLDAEYYQPKYNDYLQVIKSYVYGFNYLQKVCALKDDNYSPNDMEKYKYIELADIGNAGNITGCTMSNGNELPTRARRIVNTNDVIVPSIEGSLSSCALVAKEYNNALCSTGFYVVNSEIINSATLLVLFKSELMQNILKQHCSGTILTAINKPEYLNIPIPLINPTIQKKIVALIEQSFALREESEQLLEQAKTAVERKIEGR